MSQIWLYGCAARVFGTPNKIENHAFAIPRSNLFIPCAVSGEIPRRIKGSIYGQCGGAGVAFNSLVRGTQIDGDRSSIAQRSQPNETVTHIHRPFCNPRRDLAWRISRLSCGLRDDPFTFSLRRDFAHSPLCSENRYFIK
jgi:hypothetical protein